MTVDEIRKIWPEAHWFEWDDSLIGKKAKNRYGDIGRIVGPDVICPFRDSSRWCIFESGIWLRNCFGVIYRTDRGEIDDLIKHGEKPAQFVEYLPSLTPVD